MMTRTCPLCKQTNKRPSGAKAIAVAAPGIGEPHCDSVKPAGNVAALMGKNPPPRKSHTTQIDAAPNTKTRHVLAIRPPSVSTDPDSENFVGLAARMLNTSSASYSSFVNFASSDLGCRN